MTILPIKSREVHLISRPIGIPSKQNFTIAKNTISELQDGEVLVKNLYFSVDPYMRGRMADRKSYAAPFELNQPMDGGCVGEIIVSRSKKFKIGEFVYGFSGWREYFVSDGQELMKIDPTLVPLQSYLGALGLTGFTAYIGLFEIGKVLDGDTIYISAAAGAVGSMVCQIAKIKQCTVIGSAGSQKKVDWLLNKVGIDIAFNYKDVSNLRAELKKHCPNGIDLYFDNVGGEFLDAALFNMNKFGRIVICGMISQYNKSKPDPIYNLILTIQKRLSIKGFLVGDHMSKLPEFLTQMSKWYVNKQIIQEETITVGIENSVDAFLGLFSGENLGKMMVKL
ncbi:MAG: NADP-dependent oxidoreductase [Candidatus Lokiarchaeota archaeon]|nr:NADP-dependent oxidoreductase [Candidatus Lokiarchaeota archaeon]